MSKPRLLIPIDQHFVIRYILRTGMLERLSEFSNPIVALGWEDEALKKEMEHVGAEVYIMPDFKFGKEFEHARSRVNQWHRWFRHSPTTDIDRRRNRSFLTSRMKITSSLRELFIFAEVSVPGGIERILARDEQCFWNDTNAREFELLNNLAHPDALFSVTPFDVREEPLLRLASRQKIPCYASVLSFDNITSRTWFPIRFDQYLLWNHHNADQLKRAYPFVTATDITITGPPQFDFYWDKQYLWDERTWRSELGLPAGRQVILFGGGHYRIVPNEPYLLKQIDQDIENGKIKGKPIVLFRRHPGDQMERWKGVLSSVGHVRVENSWPAYEKTGHTNVSRFDIEKLTSTLFFSEVHINTSSTLTVDGAIFNRPQTGPAYDANSTGRYNGILRDLYRREHYLPITESGGLDIAYSQTELVQAINNALLFPEQLAPGRKKIVQEICTFNDGKSAERIIHTLARLLSG